MQSTEFDVSRTITEINALVQSFGNGSSVSEIEVAQKLQYLMLNLAQEGYWEVIFKILRSVSGWAPFKSDFALDTYALIKSKTEPLRFEGLAALLQSLCAEHSEQARVKPLLDALAAFASRHGSSENVAAPDSELVRLQPTSRDLANISEHLNRPGLFGDGAWLQFAERAIEPLVDENYADLVALCLEEIESEDPERIGGQLCAAWILSYLNNCHVDAFNLQALKAANEGSWRRIQILFRQPLANYAAIYHKLDLTTGKEMDFYLFRPEGLVSESEKETLKSLLPQNGENLMVVELGSFSGFGSTPLFLDAVKTLGGQLYCIDLWPETAGIDLYRIFIENVDLLDPGAHLNLISGDSSDQAALFADASLDLVFVDAGHSYDFVSKDMRAWAPKVKPGGVLCGHDCRWYVRDFDRAELEEKSSDMGMADFVTYRGPDPSLANENGQVWMHAGVLLAVDEFFGEDYSVAGVPDGIWYARV